MQTRSWTVMLLVGAMSAAVLLLGTHASACHNEVERVRDPRVDALQMADRLLLQTDNVSAARVVSRHFPGLRDREAVKGTLPLRAARVLALITVRSGGGWYEGKQLVMGSQEERAANLQWAIRQLEERAGLSPDSTSRRADLGEAMAQVPRERLRARYLLEELDKYGRLRSPFALAALAELRERDGDKKGATKARRDCVARTRNAAVCKAPEVEVPGNAA